MNPSAALRIGESRSALDGFQRSMVAMRVHSWKPNAMKL